MTDVFEAAAARADPIEAGLDTLTAGIAQALMDPPSTWDAVAIGQQIDALEAHRPALRDAQKQFNRISKQPRGADTRAQAAIRSRFRAVAFRLKHWDRITRHLHGILTPVPVPLRPDPRELPLAKVHERDVVESLYKTLHLLSNPSSQDPDALALGAFSDIPLKYYPFVDLLTAGLRLALAQRRDRPLRFLDVGCGGGTKVLIAASYFDQADGLEYDPGYVAASHRLMQMANARRCDIFEGDALSYAGYGHYDFVYFFRPLSDPIRIIELERQISENVPPGTILLAPYDGFLERYQTYGHAWLGKWLYLAHTSAEDARAIQAEAELIGSDIRLPTTLLNRRLGFWEAPIEAAFANGRGLIL